MAAVPVVDFVTLGFHMSSADAVRMERAHRHNEIEITLLNEGWIDYLIGGRRIRIPAGVLCVRWAALPHQSVDFDPGGPHYSLKVPLAWFLSWEIPPVLVRRLMAGELLQHAEVDPGSSDRSMMQRWQRAFDSRDPQQLRMIRLEAEARLLRLAAMLPLCESGPGDGAARAVGGQFGKFERMAVFIGNHSTRPISVAEIAVEGGLHPNSAMRLFRRTCGLTILEYLTMHRICHAQHLLATTALKIRTVAESSGFSSPGRFYAAFEKVVGKKPGEYRDSVSGLSKSR